MRIFFLLILLLAFSGCGESTYVEPTPGQAVFLNNCIGCHRGDGNPPGPNTTMLNSLQTTDPEKFRAYLRKPTHSLMPAFPQNALSDADVDLLYQYLQETKTASK